MEDRLETCYFLDEAAGTPIVFEQPWNRKLHPFQTVRRWDEISAMIDWSMKLPSKEGKGFDNLLRALDKLMNMSFIIRLVFLIN